MVMPVKMVNYETPVGTFADWQEAADACERADMDPCTCIKTVPINYRDTCTEFAYGTSFRLSQSIRVF